MRRTTYNDYSRQMLEGAKRLGHEVDKVRVHRYGGERVVKCLTCGREAISGKDGYVRGDLLKHKCTDATERRKLGQKMSNKDLLALHPEKELT